MIDLAVTGTVDTQNATTSYTVSILLGIGDGTFGEKTPYQIGSGTLGTGPYSVTTGDFNDNNTIDLAVTNVTSNKVSILSGIGDGTFAQKVDYAVGTSPRTVTTSDFNKDGHSDLAVVNRDDFNVSILLGVGDGTFSPKTDYAVGADPYSVATGDFNNDNETDLAVANYISNSLSILLGVGDGTFGEKSDIAVGTYPYSVTTGDFNADHKTDLVISDYQNKKVGVLLGKGNATFGVKSNYTVGSGPGSVSVGDFDSDHRVDLAVTNYLDNDVSILMNVNPVRPVVIKMYPKVGGVKIKVGSGTKTITPFDSRYKKAVWAREIQFGKNHSHYVLLNSYVALKGAIKVYDENGEFIQLVKPFNKSPIHGVNADIISQPSNGKVYLAVSPKLYSKYRVRVYEVTKTGLVKVNDVAAGSRSATWGTFSVKFLKLYGNNYGLTTINKGTTSTLKIWRYSSSTKTWVQDTTVETRAKVRVDNGKVVLR
jgi:hypothetical protein